MTNCLIVGAGLAGLTAARELEKNGVEVTLCDKGRGVGGRLATRRFDGATFDHGAQFFTTRDPEFREMAALWREDGVAEEWFEGFPSPENSRPEDLHSRFRGAPGMTGIAKFLAQNLKIELGATISAVSQDEKGLWRTEGPNKILNGFQSLILTPPVPQSLVLLQAGGVSIPNEARRTLETISYEPCFALMVLLDGPSQVPAPGALYLEGGPLSWVADNFQKGVSLREGALTLHATGKWTRDHFDEAPETVAPQLLEAAAPFLGAKVETWQLHRWRYSKPENPLQIGTLFVPELRLAFAGDAFCGARVEGAALSGLAAARAFLANRE